MAKCRNCQKEIDNNATRCPYCHTELPTSEFVGKVKGILIAAVVIGFVAIVLYYIISGWLTDLAGLDIGVNYIFVAIFGFISWFTAFKAVLLYNKTKDEYRRERKGDFSFSNLPKKGKLLALAAVVSIILAMISIFFNNL